MNRKNKSLYIETTIPSYATGRISADIITAGKQAQTRRFWEQEHHRFDLKISEFVLEECKQGDLNAAQRRLIFLHGIMVLPKTSEIIELAKVYQNLLRIPVNAETDCFHLSTCVLNNIDFLLTWNCAHLGTLSYIKTKEYNDLHGLWTPVLVTPESIYSFLTNEGEQQ